MTTEATSRAPRLQRFLGWALLATLLVIASRRLHVPEDPRVGRVEEMLPHANCGACGLPGCRPFAEALVAGSTEPAKCTVSDEAGRLRIATFLGVDVGQAQKRVARLACAGGTNVARSRAAYAGLSSCAGASLVGGGGKGCTWGCLGWGDCVTVCQFGALALDGHQLPQVDEQRCTACGDCVAACPKDLFSLVPVERRLFVRCQSLLSGEAALTDCEVGCDACGRCAKDDPSLVRMGPHLPIIDTGRPHASDTAIQRCPTGAIVWLEPDGTARKGPEAGDVIRTGPRQPGPT